jgi:dienelactone hydrolase
MHKEVNIVADSLSLPGTLALPEKAYGLVLFAHGSGSSRFSSRNRFVAGVLQEAQIGTLLFDLLTAEEDQVYENRFNIDLITARLIKATEWLVRQNATRDLPLGYFGASTGAAAVLEAAASLGSRIKAVVSRGGRPDLALEVLDRVEAPTLFIVGGMTRSWA